MFPMTYRHDNEEGGDSRHPYIAKPTSARVVGVKPRQSYEGRDVR
jgi:hypothetical protein